MRVLYIDLDVCRADHLRVNGYHRNTSPNVDRIAEEGITFTHCYCANSPCLPSRASLFTGLRSAGDHSVSIDARGLPAGIYYCCLKAGASRLACQLTHLR